LHWLHWHLHVYTGLTGESVRMAAISAAELDDVFVAGVDADWLRR